MLYYAILINASLNLYYHYVMLVMMTLYPLFPGAGVSKLVCAPPTADSRRQGGAGRERAAWDSPGACGHSNIGRHTLVEVRQMTTYWPLIGH